MATMMPPCVRPPAEKISRAAGVHQEHRRAGADVIDIRRLPNRSEAETARCRLHKAENDAYGLVETRMDIGLFEHRLVSCSTNAQYLVRTERGIQMEIASDTATTRAGNGADRVLTRSGKIRLLTLDVLDQRTAAAKLFVRMVADIENDLGGHGELSTIERALVEGFAGAAVSLANLNTRLALGESIDLSQHAQVVSAMVRITGRLGVTRRQRDVTTLADYLSTHAPGDDDAAEADEAAEAETAR
jgi:hypothetical protein